MKNKIYILRIFLIALILLLSSALVSAGDFNIYNTSDGSQTYFAVNGTTGNTGLGTSNPTTLLQLLNNRWISALNNLTTGAVNMFKVNENDAIELGATLNIGSFEFNEDSGLVTFVDMPVSSTPSAGTSESYVFKVDGDNIMTIYSEADGSGGVQNKRVGIGTTSPIEPLHVYTTGSNKWIKVESDSGYTGLYIKQGQGGTSGWVIVGGYPNSGDLTFREADTADYMTIKQTTGNVGIGTSTPSRKLEVAGEIGAGTDTDGIVMYLSGTTGTILGRDMDNNAYNALHFRTAASPSGIFIDTAGEVGIGTASPTDLLHISGENKKARIETTTAADVGWVFAHSAASNWTIGIDNSDRGFKISESDGAFGTNDRFLIDEGGNVGIGTTSPVSELDIEGGTFSLGGGSINTEISQTGTILREVNDSEFSGNQSYAGFGIIAESGTNRQGYLFMDGSSSNIIFDILTSQDTGATWLDRFVVTQAGNVGIGTATPQNTLNVIGDGNFTGLIYGNGSQLTDVGASPGGTEGAIQFYDGGNLGGNASQFFINKTSGNVGIGTDSPAAKLDLSHDAASGDVLNIASSADEYFKITQEGYVSIKSLNHAGVYIRAGNVSSYPVFGLIDEGSGSAIQWNIVHGQRGDGILSFELEGARMVINGTSGNVGIGTTTPQNPLNVIGVINATGTVYANGAALTSNTGTVTSVGSGTGLTGGPITTSGTLNVVGGTCITANADNIAVTGDCIGNTQLEFDTGQALTTGSSPTFVTAKLSTLTDGYVPYHVSDASGLANSVIYTDGTNVGIGTTGPASLLHLGADGGQMRVGTTGGGRSAVVGSKLNNVGGGSNEYAAYFAYDAYFDDSDDTWKPVRTTLGNKFKMEMGYHTQDIRFSYSSGYDPISWSDLLTIEGDGDVGIGTTSPSELLHLSSSSNTTQIIQAAVNNDSTLKLLETGTGDVGAYLRYDGSNNRFGIWVGNNPPSERLTILRDSGNVGIGTTSPGRKLDVESSGVIADFQSTTDTSYIDIVATGTQLRAGVFAGVAGISEGAGTSADLAIDSSGNVGIGTTTPQNPLNVIGAINATGTVYSGGSAVLTSYTETDPKWTGNYSAKTGTGNVVFSTSPTLTTPNIGAATAGGTLDMNNNAITNINWAGSDDGSGSGLDADTLDTIDSLSFLRSDADDTLTSTMKVTGSIIHEETTSFGYIEHPDGAYFLNNTVTATGAIKIALPTVNTSDMMSFWVDIFDYTNAESISIFIAGYNYNVGSWTNPTALILSPDTNKQLTVRFGEEDAKDCVWIGETDSTWSYPQVIVRDFMGGYSTDIDAYDDGWAITQITSFGTVERTISTTFPVASDVVCTNCLTNVEVASADYATTAGGAPPTGTASGDLSGSYPSPTIAANAVALGTDTTGSYAAGTAEAGSALTGDSATAFFSTGTLEDARVVDTITASNYVRKSTWTDIDDYPTGCGAGTAVRIIGDTLTCIEVGGAVEDVWVNESGDTMTGNLNMNSQGIWYAANGSMGIGTTSPDEKLQVIGNVMIGETDTTGGTLELWGTTAGKYSTIKTTSGNLHIDSDDSSTYPIYLNWYGGTGGVIFGTGASAQAGAISAAGALTIATVNTGYGANELWDMNQHVLTTSSPTFAGLTLSGGYLDDDTTLGGLTDDWLRINTYIEMRSATDSYGIVLRDKDTSSYFGITQVVGVSYLTDSSTYGNYFIKGDGANAWVRGTLEVGDHASAGTDKTVNVVYGTGSPPTATTTTIGTLWVKYTA